VLGARSDVARRAEHDAPSTTRGEPARRAVDAARTARRTTRRSGLLAGAASPGRVLGARSDVARRAEHDAPSTTRGEPATRARGAPVQQSNASQHSVTRSV
jgi:hypothetical protein